MRLPVFLIAAFAAAFIAGPALAAGGERIAVVVNEDALTHSDIDDRLRLIMVSSGMPDAPEIRAKLEPQIVSAMVDEQIRLQEAKKKEVDVSQAEVDGGFAEIAAQNKLKPEQFKEILNRNHLSIASMETQIRAQIAWAKVVQKELRPRINVTDSDIDARLEMLRANIGKTEYLAAEIFLPVDEARKEADARQLAAQLVGQVRGGKVPFFKLAKEFSQSAGASQGGDLGWVQQGQLEPELDAVLPSIAKNNVSDPIRTLTGYHILMVREQRAITQETMPARDQVLNMIGLERLQRQAQRYFLDLKSSAYIDNRIKS
jgi:peptidyl-prolyl cis-trans isomerase SurA